MRCRKCGAESDVLDTRRLFNDFVMRRRRKCHNDHVFWTLEINAVAFPSVKRYVERNAEATVKKLALERRDRIIIRRVQSGERLKDVASEFNIRAHTASSILRKHGVQDMRRKHK